MTTETDMRNLPVGTPVTITAEGVWMQGAECTIARSYTIRFGHRMYDLTTKYGTTLTYYSPGQLTLT